MREARERVEHERAKENKRRRKIGKQNKLEGCGLDSFFENKAIFVFLSSTKV